MRIVFMGTPDYAATIAEELLMHHEIVACFTKPDAVRGRGNVAVPSAVKQFALSYNVPVFTPKTLRDPQVIQQIAELKPHAIIVAAYSLMVPAELLDIPLYGCLNVHASLLPRWRGAAPVERAILAGDADAGVSIMRMTPNLDDGPFCISRTCHIEEKTADELSDELANLGAQCLLTALSHIESGCARWVEQDELKVTYARKIEKGDLDVRFEDDALSATRKVRASSDAHPSKIVIAGKPSTLIAVREVPTEELLSMALPAEFFFTGKGLVAHKKLLICMTSGVLEVLYLKPDGKKLMTGQAFASGIQGAKERGFRWEALQNGSRL